MARGLLDVLREFSDNENDFISVMETVARMSEDGGRLIFISCLSRLKCLKVVLHLLIVDCIFVFCIFSLNVSFIS